MYSDLFSIFQIGDVVLRLESEKWHGYDTKVNATSVPLLMSDQFKWSPLYSNKPTTVSVKGTIHRTHLAMLDQTIARLQVLAKREINIIAFTDLDELPASLGVGENHAYSAGLLWFETTGVLEAVSVSPTSDLPEVSLTLSFGPYWQPLNRFDWEYRAAKYNPGTTFDYPSAVKADYDTFVSPYVERTAIEEYYNHGFIWAKRNITDIYALFAGNYMLDPDAWSPLLQNNLRAGFPSIGIANQVSTMLTHTHTVTPDVTLFNAPPKSIYRLRLYDTSLNIPVTTGTLTIRVSTTYDGWHYTIRTTTLSFSELLLYFTQAGLGSAFSQYDYIYFGDTFISPGFFAYLTPNGSILRTEVYPPFFFPDAFPAMLTGLQSTIQVVINDSNVAGLDYAYMHMYRRY